MLIFRDVIVSTLVLVIFLKKGLAIGIIGAAIVMLIPVGLKISNVFCLRIFQNKIKTLFALIP